MKKLPNKIKKVLRNVRLKAMGFYCYHCPGAMALIGVTYSCQCNCAHCAVADYADDKKKELNREELFQIIDALPKKKVKGVYFFGGEPLMRGEIAELVKRAHNRGFLTTMDTNALFLDKQKIRDLKKSGLTQIGISIDSPNPETHDKLRGKKNIFYRAIEGIKECRKENLICYVSCYATKENLANGDLEKIVALAEEYGADYTRIVPPLPMGKWLEKKDWMLAGDDRKKMKKLRKLGPISIEDNRCMSMSKKLFYISPYGEIQPCFSIPLKFGNIRNEKLEEILKRMWKHPMFASTSKKYCPLGKKSFKKKYISDIAHNNPLIEVNDR